MPEQEARRKLADRAFSIWRTADPAISYTTAVDKALAELNPNRQAIRAKAIIYLLLNVDEPVVQRNRISPRSPGQEADPVPFPAPADGVDETPAPDAPEDPGHD